MSTTKAWTQAEFVVIVIHEGLRLRHKDSLTETIAYWESVFIYSANMYCVSAIDRVWYCVRC